MPRERRMIARTISDGDRVDLLSDRAALLYTWAIVWLEDYGQSEASIKWLKRNVVPGRNWLNEDVQKYRQEIIDNKLMVFYKINGKEYWQQPPQDWEWNQRGSWHGKARKDSHVPCFFNEDGTPKTDKTGVPPTPKTDEIGVVSGQGKGSKGKGSKDKLKKDIERPIKTALSPPKKAIKKKKIKKPENPEIKVFIDYYHDLFLEKFKEKPVIDGGKDGAIIKSLLSTYGLDRLKGLLRGFFDLDDPFVQTAGYSIGVFKGQINKIISARNESTQTQEGYWEKRKADDEEYEKMKREAIPPERLKKLVGNYLTNLEKGAKDDEKK